MSAINIIRQRDAVHIVASGGGYDAAGNLLITRPNVWPLLKHRAMFSTRGPALLASMLAGVLSAVGDYSYYDELRREIVPLLRDQSTLNRDALSICQAGDEFDLVVAGWSETDGADSYVICNHTGLGIEPWTVVRLGEVALMPGTPEIHAEFHRLFPGIGSADDLDPDRDGVKILEMQRRHAIDTKTAEGLSIVGGLAQLATVHSDGRFESRITHRWPDRIGERVGGALKEAVPA